MTTTKAKSLKEKYLNLLKEVEVPKRQFNKFSGFYYRSLEDILAEIRPLLVKHGLILEMSEEILPIESSLFVKVVAHLKNSAVGGPINDNIDKITVTGWAAIKLDKKGMDPAQATGAAISYARKYALSALFLLSDKTEEIDAQEAEEKESKEEKKEKTNKQKIIAEFKKQLSGLKTKEELQEYKKQFYIKHKNVLDKDVELLQIIKELAELREQSFKS